jgi:hypothetical protein
VEEALGRNDLGPSLVVKGMVTESDDLFQNFAQNISGVSARWPPPADTPQGYAS